ncbi:hypothetical protein [Sphingobium phenoxybenzoativorans]|uniref:hypothetical protein n=1 Tax=Sphingobium phenoxybenzoativorans TaxID=1592790 RepID=UPI000872E71D|nr:hypothetical protein [Sphingobium phenoxybenzoativorans]
MTRIPRRGLGRTLIWPAIIGVATLAGLVLGLLDDGLNDVAAWLGVGLPLAVIGLFMAKR